MCDTNVMRDAQSSWCVDLILDKLGRVIDAVCESVEGREWLVIQRRERGDVSFDRGWAAYRDGFGQVNATGDFWLGMSMTITVLPKKRPLLYTYLHIY